MPIWLVKKRINSTMKGISLLFEFVRYLSKYWLEFGTSMSFTKRTDICSRHRQESDINYKYNNKPLRPDSAPIPNHWYYLIFGKQSVLSSGSRLCLILIHEDDEDNIEYILFIFFYGNIYIIFLVLFGIWQNMLKI